MCFRDSTAALAYNARRSYAMVGMKVLCFMQKSCRAPPLRWPHPGLDVTFSAAVAQWIEYWPPKPRVVGSIPASRTINSSLLAIVCCHWNSLSAVWQRIASKFPWQRIASKMLIAFALPTNSPGCLDGRKALKAFPLIIDKTIQLTYNVFACTRCNMAKSRSTDFKSKNCAPS